MFSNNAEAVSDNGLTNLAAVELGALSDRPDSEISSVESDDGVDFDLLEDMFAEGVVLQGDGGSAPDQGAALEWRSCLPKEPRVSSTRWVRICLIDPKQEPAGE